MKFWAYVKQRGEGCGYTIACGEAIWEIEANSWEDAVEEARLFTVGNPKWEEEDDDVHMGQWLGRPGKRPRLEWVRLVEIVREEEMPIVEWYAARVAEHEEIERQEHEQYERERYEQLKQKYGD